jgi:hypothetical protein
MTERFDNHSLRRDLSAFVDGELDPVAAERLLRQLASDSQAAQTLQQLQQLTAATRRAVRNQTPQPSQQLRDRLLQIMDSKDPSSKPAISPPNRIVRFWWPVLSRSLAAGLLLAVGAWIGHRWIQPSLPRPNDNAIAPVPLPAPVRSIDADPLPATVISTAEEIHGFCSRLTDGLHEAGYPSDLAPLASAVESDRHTDRPYPDLTPIGYRYRGAGPCGRTLPDTVHLLYRSMRPGSFQAISIFVQGWHDQYPLDTGQLYTVSVASSPFPMLAWRTNKIVYFLLADDAETVQRCVKLIRKKPSTRKGYISTGHP